MKNRAQILIVGAALAAVCPVPSGGAVVQGPTWEATSHSIRVMAGTDAPATAKLKWGKTGLSATTTFTLTGAVTIHGVSLTGLDPDTVYLVQFCALDGSTGAESCAPPFRAQTKPADLTPPALPRAVSVPLEPPTSPGAVVTVGPDCLSSSNGLQYWLDHAAFGDTIVLPRTTTNCWGRFFYRRSAPESSPYITLRTDAPDSELPPPGVMIASADVNLETGKVKRAFPWLAKMPTIWHTAPNHLYSGLVTAGTSCRAENGAGSFAPVFTADWQVYKCAPSTTGMPISNVATATPILVTAPNHGLSTGNHVLLQGVGGLPAVNDYFQVTVLNANLVSLQFIGGSHVSAAGSYAGGGVLRRLEWTPVTRTTGLGRPAGACTTGAWYQDKAAAGDWWTNQLWRCIDGQWVRSLIENQNGPVAGFEIAAGSSNLYVLGVRFKAMKIPEEPEWASSPVFGFAMQRGSTYQNIVQSAPDARRLVFDRVIIDGSIDDNVRTAVGIWAEGAEVALVNSAVIGLGQFQRSYTLSPGNYPPNNNITSAAVLITCGPGPGLVQNNLLEAYGLTFYIDDTCQSSAIDPPADYTARRNILFRDDKYYEASPTWQENPLALKRRWNLRQVFEQKNGQRVLYEGNRIIGGWADGTATSCAWVFTPYNSFGALANSVAGGWVTVNAEHRRAVNGLRVGDIVWFYGSGAAIDGWHTVTSVSGLPAQFQIDSGTSGPVLFGKLNTRQTTRDITIRHNTVTTQSCGVQAWGVSYFRNQQPYTGGRFLVENNFFYKLDGSRGTPGSGFASPESGTASYDYRFDNGIEDVTIRHNTSVGRIPAPSFGNPSTGVLVLDWFNTQGGGKSAGLRFQNNISTYGTFGIQRNPGVTGQAALDAEFSSYEWSQNLLIRPEGSAAGMPAGTLWTTDVSPDFYLPERVNFRVRGDSAFSSSGASRASTGLSVGANLDTLAAEQGQVLNVRAISVNRDSAVLGFVAPDAEGCPVDWSVNGSASATRVTNLGGARSQQVELSDLPSDSEISARILCRSAQPLVTFRTLP